MQPASSTLIPDGLLAAMTLLSENPRLGFESKNPALHPVHNIPNFTAAIGDSWSVASESRWSHEMDGLMAHHFVHFAQNHDQIGNRGWGERLEHLVGLHAAKVAIGLVLTAPYIPMLFMGEEWCASSPFLYFADHEDEEMRKKVAEGRRREFAAFGFDGDVPSPEAQETYEMSKLKWEEQSEGAHAEMLAWVKALIRVRRGHIALNDGDMHHLMVSSDEEGRTLVLERDEVRVLINFGEEPQRFSLLKSETLELISRDGNGVCENHLELPPMTLAVLLSDKEEAENRQVARKKR